jgi:hypothetical protein
MADFIQSMKAERGKEESAKRTQAARAANLPGVTGEMTDTPDTLRMKLSGLIAEGLMKLGWSGRGAYDEGGKLTTVAEVGTPVGMVTGMEDLARAENPREAAMAAMGLVPGVGKEAKAAGKVAPDVAKAVDELFAPYAGARPDIPQTNIARYEPKKTPERISDITSSQDVRQKMLTGIEQGRDMRDWYNMQPLKLAYIDKLGPDEGAKRFDRLMDYVAASSPRSGVDENIRNATFYAGLDLRGDPLPEPYTTEAGKTIKNPAPYGHLAQDLHRMNFEKIRSGPGLDVKANPKPLGFGWNLKGNWQPVAVDAHAFNAPAMLAEDPRFLSTSFKASKEAAPVNIRKQVESGDIGMPEALARPAWWEGKPKETEYLAMEKYYQDLAREAGVDPAEVQAMGWVGHGPMTGLKSRPNMTAMDFMKDRLGITSQAQKMDPRDVLSDLIMRGAPLL